MPPSSTAVHGGQHGTKNVTFELLLPAAFVADEIWGFMLEPARTHPRKHVLDHAGYAAPTRQQELEHTDHTDHTAVSYTHLTLPTIYSV